MSFTKVFSAYDKKTVMTVAAAGLLALVSVVGIVSANGPSFNIFPISYSGALNTDFPLLDARNATKGESWSTSQSDHDAGVTAEPGDEIEFLIYYHNGAANAPENIAPNVVAKANVPGFSGNSFTVSAQISSSNAATVSSSSKGGDVQVQVSGPVTQTMTLVSGSTVWMPNRASQSFTMPNTITTNGISLGSIQACWEFTGFIKFRVKVSNNQPNLSLAIDKTVRNVTSSTSFSNQVNANPGDTVEFKIVGTNTSQVTLNDVVMRDVLPAKLTYVNNSLSVSKSFTGDFFGSGAALGSVGAGQQVTATFRATVAGESQFNIGTTELVNTGYIKNTGGQPVAEISDIAKVIVTKQQPQVCTVLVRATFNNSPWSGSLNYRITGPQTINGSSVPSDHSNVTPGSYTASYLSGGPSGANYDGVEPLSGSCPSSGFLTFTYKFSRQDVYDLSIDKTVRNVTTGGSFGDSTIAAPSQTVEFKVVVRNTGNTDAQNVTARDVLPNKLTYVNGTLTINGSSASNDNQFFGAGLNVGTLVVNESKTFIFRATVAAQNEFSVGTTQLTNTAYAWATNVSQKQDSATVTVEKQAPQKEDGNGGSRPF